MMAAIETHALTKIFAPPTGWRRLVRAAPITAVSPISLTIPQGSLFGLLGPNGAGKTTLVKMLCTLILPSSGTAQVMGYDLAQTGLIRGAVGLVVSDERSFYWRLSGRRNLHFFAALYGLHGRLAHQRIEAVLAQVALHPVADRPFSHYSSGMRQRLAIARSLLHQPRLLFLDEPTRSLDPTATQRLHTLLQHLVEKQHITIFLVTHDLAEAEKLCHQVAFMHHGRIQAIGSPQTLRQRLRPHHHYTLTLDTPLTPAALHHLQQIEPTVVSRDGRLTFSLPRDSPTLTAILDQLRQQEIHILTIDAVPPTLEEAFTHFTAAPTAGTQE